MLNMSNNTKWLKEKAAQEDNQPISAGGLYAELEKCVPIVVQVSLPAYWKTMIFPKIQEVETRLPCGGKVLIIWIISVIILAYLFIIKMVKKYTKMIISSLLWKS